MKYHALFVIFETAEKFEIVFCSHITDMETQIDLFLRQGPGFFHFDASFTELKKRKKNSLDFI